MTRPIGTILALLLTACLVVVVVRQWPGVHDPVRTSYVDGEADDESEARAEWELMRQRNPATGRIPDGMRGRELAYAATMPQRAGGGAFYKSLGVAAYEWENRGPYNIGGRTRALALDVTGEDTIVAGGVSGGLWRSSDGGASWTRGTRPGQYPGVTCIVQDVRPGRTNVWYCGTGEGVGSSPSSGGSYYLGNGLFKSTDNGRSWEPIASTVSQRVGRFDSYTDIVYNVALDRSNRDQDELYCATYGSIRRSVHGGDSLEAVLTSLASPSYFTDVAVTDSGVVYATMSSDGGKRGLWRSEDGVHYTGITPSGWPSNYRRVVIGITPSNQNIVYFLAETPGFGRLGKNFRGDSSWQSLWRYTYRSGDGSGDGGTWEDLSANLPAIGGSFGDFFSQTGYDLHVTVSPHDENLVFVGGTNLYRSTDGFRTSDHVKWIGGYQNVQIDSMVVQGYSYPGHHPDQHALVFSRRDPNVAYTGSDGGVHKTLDCTADSVAWISLDNGYVTSQFYSVAQDPATPGSRMVIGGLQDNGTWGTLSGDAATPWSELGSGDGSFCAIVGGGREILVSKQEGKTYRVLLDENGRRTAFARIDPLGGSGYLFINPFAVDPNREAMLFLSGGSYLWRNSDITAAPFDSTSPVETNWTRFDKTLAPNDAKISAVAVSSANPAHRVYYGTSDGKVYRLDDADSGEPDPISATSLSFPKGGYVNCIAVDPLDGNRAVVVFSNYEAESLFLTTDGGETWSAIGGNLEPSNGDGPSCRWFSFLHRSNGTICFVGTSTGLYSTNKLDGKQTYWAQEGPSAIGNVVVDMIDVRQSDGHVVIGTHGRGVFETNVETLGIERPGDDVADSRMLGQGYPNPARDIVTIPFMVPFDAERPRVRIDLFDARGAAVRTVVDDRFPGGPHSRTVDLRTLVPGTYFCRLTMGNHTEERALVVEK